MKWTVKLIAETPSGESVEHQVATIERADVASPATVGLTIVEGKAILEGLQEQIVVAQIQLTENPGPLPFNLTCGVPSSLAASAEERRRLIPALARSPTEKAPR